MYITRIDERYYMVMLLLPLVGIILIRNLKLLAPFSQLANIITFIGLGIVLWYIFTDLPDVSSKPLFGEPRKYTLFVGTTLFALEAVGVVSRPGVRREMSLRYKCENMYGVSHEDLLILIGEIENTREKKRAVLAYACSFREVAFRFNVCVLVTTYPSAVLRFR